MPRFDKKEWHDFIIFKNDIINPMPSSVILRISYDVATSTLRVVFVSGTIYDYKNVPEEIYHSMKAATSKGAYLNQHIKGNYSFEKIT